jgi:hypothetical protein
MSLVGMGQVSTAVLAQPVSVLAAASETPMRVGSTPAIAQQSCVNANGTWDSINNACALPGFPALPSYCGWFPFAASLFSECALPTATDLTNVGAYTAYQAGMINNDPSVTASLMTDNATQSASLLATNTDCAYNAAQNSPGLSQIFGPTLTCALTDPTSATFWMLYAVLGLGVYMFLKGKG